jgi:RNA polymerase sigma-70 factor, ECF subfamily
MGKASHGLSDEKLADCYQQVRRYAASHCAAGEAEDIAQETVARFLAQRDFSHDGPDPVAWMMTVARRLWMDGYKFRQKVAVSEEQVRSRTTASAPSALDVVLENEQSARLADAFGLLSPQQQAIIRDKFVLGLSYEEISAATDMKVNALRVRASRARERFAELLGDLRNAGLLVLLRWRTRRTFFPAEAPAYAATALAQVAVPLAMVAGAVTMTPLLSRHHAPPTRPVAMSAPAGGTADDLRPEAMAFRSASMTRSRASSTGGNAGDTRSTRVSAGDASVEHTETKNPDGSSSQHDEVKLGDDTVYEHDGRGWTGDGPSLTCRLLCPHDPH